MQEQNSVNSDLEHLQKLLRQSVQKLQRKLIKQQEEFEEAEKHLWYKQIADSILAAPDKFSQKESKINVFNVYTQKEELVSVNPKLDIKANAQLLYKKSKKAKRGEEINTKKVEATKEQIKRFLFLDNEVDSALKDEANSEKQKVLQKQLEEELIRIDPKMHLSPEMHQSDKKNKVPFHHFVTEGWDLFIGKSDTQNDELSIHFAHPSDLWLHVAGYAGSHVIIRRPKGKAFPPAEILQKAASLAVWFSKAKHTSFSEVHYTEARFVHKRRHAPAGEVIAERCKSMRVSPKSPQDLFRTPFLEDSSSV